MNCLLQKAMKDRVLVNHCSLDSVLWFHLECPRMANKWDDPMVFKKKFRDFFTHNKTLKESIDVKSETDKRLDA